MSGEYLEGLGIKVADDVKNGTNHPLVTDELVRKVVHRYLKQDATREQKKDSKPEPKVAVDQLALDAQSYVDFLMYEKWDNLPDYMKDQYDEPPKGCPKCKDSYREWRNREKGVKATQPQVDDMYLRGITLVSKTLRTG